MRKKVGQLRSFIGGTDIGLLHEVHGERHEVERILNALRSEWRWHFNDSIFLHLLLSGDIIGDILLELGHRYIFIVRLF